MNAFQKQIKIAQWNHDKSRVYLINMQTGLLNETKTGRYVSDLNKKYDNEEFCFVNTNAIYQSHFLK